MATKADIERMIPGARESETDRRSQAIENPTWAKIWMGPRKGEFGAWVDAVEPPEPGERIEMETKGGQISHMIMDEIIWSGIGKFTGRPGHLVSLKREERGAPAKRAPAARRAPAPAAPIAPAPEFRPVQHTPEPIVAVAPAEERKWSPLQEAIFQEAMVGQGHVVVLARAGAGKSSTAEEAIRRLPQTSSVLFTAFAKKIFEEARERFVMRPAPNVEIAGINSYGFKVVKRSFPRIGQVDKYKAYKLSDGIVGDGRNRGDYGKTAKSALVNTVRLMKETLTYDPDGVDALMDKYEIDAGADLNLTDPDVRGQFVHNAIRLLEATKADTSRVDFSDQIWFPLVLDLPPGRLLYDAVFVDECQDLSAAKLELTMRAVKKTGRIFAIGDDRQAIFGFAGADEEAVPHIIERLRAKILKLTISYRCSIAIAEVAKLIVPDFESGATNKDGTPKVGVVEEKHYSRMLREAEPGDFIISRVNAPLVKICMALLRAGKKAVIAGREDAIGKALLLLIETAEKKGARTVIELQTWATQWADRETERLLSKRPPREEEAEMVSDKVDCIDALAQGAGSIREIAEKIESLFSDEDNETRIVCTSTHKAKGLERERAWVLRNTYMKRPGTQEANLWYVAVTRAKGFLFLVDLPVRGED